MRCLIFGHVPQAVVPSHGAGKGHTITYCAVCGNTLQAPSDDGDAMPRIRTMVSYGSDHLALEVSPDRVVIPEVSDRERRRAGYLDYEVER